MLRKLLIPLGLFSAFTQVSCNKPTQETTDTLGLLENAETFVHKSMTTFCQEGATAIAPSIPQEFNYLLADLEQASQSVGGFTRVDLVSARLDAIEFQDDSQIGTNHPNRLRVTTVMEGSNNNGTAIYLILAGTPGSWEIIDMEKDEPS